VLTAILMLALACPPEDFAADVARRADLMAADVETMPHVVKEGLRQLAHDARAQAQRTEAKERIREELRAIVRRNSGAPAPEEKQP
jgi:hypothetical protein